MTRQTRAARASRAARAARAARLAKVARAARVRRVLRRTAVTSAVLAVLAGVAGYPVYVSPEVDPMPDGATVDAVVGLGGEPAVGVYARDLARRSGARSVVLSNPYHEPTDVTRLCAAPPDPPGGASRTPLTCFAPHPSTTRGEAEEIRRLAASRGWHSIVVVTTPYHVSRARMIVRRCWPGELSMVAAPIDTAPWTWVYQYGYQTAGYVKAGILRDC